MESVQSAKQRFEIIGNDPALNRAIEKALQVAPTDISVLVTGESGVGKESIPKIIHANSHRKHNKYIAVNCGAIPEGTIDSELFGHEKGAFTGATKTRRGYFEEADGGTIFLDEVGELPMTTQVRLLRVLENGEFIKVGSSQVQKTDVRIVAATNIEIRQAIKKQKFREDLYYRLSTVEIHLPPLRERSGDIHLLFRKFASDFGIKYKMPTIRLDEEAQELLLKNRWEGNVRQLRNVTEQISVLEKERKIDAKTLLHYLPDSISNLPAVIPYKTERSDFSNEREILYKVLFDMKNDIQDLKKITQQLLGNASMEEVRSDNKRLIQRIYGDDDLDDVEQDTYEDHLEILQIPAEEERTKVKSEQDRKKDSYDYAEEIKEEESLSLREKEIELIKKALERNDGRRKPTAEELGISERTLYRKIKLYKL